MAAVRLFHAASPVSARTWGLQPALARLRLVYGGEITIVEAVVVERRLDAGAAFANIAARRQGPSAGRRFLREVLRRTVIEHASASRDELLGAAGGARLDPERFARDLRDRAGLRRDLAEQPLLPRGCVPGILVLGTATRPPRPLADARPVAIERAVEEATAGALAKRPPVDVVAYLREHGPASGEEVGRVFAVAAEEAVRMLEGLRRVGLAVHRRVAGELWWCARQEPS